MSEAVKQVPVNQQDYPNPMAVHGMFGWCELRTGDPAKAEAFFTSVLGWQTEAMEGAPGPYIVVKVAGMPVAGIAGGHDGQPAWMPYVTVDDVDARIAAVRKAGGKVVTPAYDVPGVGRMAELADPTGAHICLIAYES